MHLLLNKCNFFKMEFHSNFLISKMVLYLIDGYQYHTSLKNHPKTHNLSFEVYMQIFKLYDGYYFVTNTFHMFKFFEFC